MRADLRACRVDETLAKDSLAWKEAIHQTDPASGGTRAGIDLIL